ncbi:MAG TPA: outer membrane protein [Methylocella sp.]|nr:outer membrane protein [Methylocella sp.]
MRRQFFLASVSAIATTGFALAAEPLPPPAAPPPPPAFTWTGLYAGLQVGGAWSQDRYYSQFSGAPGGVPFFLTNSVTQNLSGVIGGVHLGYNLQWNQWLVGLEGSVDGTSQQGTILDGVTGIGDQERAEIQGSIRLRAGFTWDRFLIYATGGAAFTGIHNDYTDTTGLTTRVPGVSEDISRTRSGWTVGGGIAYALTNNWSIRAEYRYSDFGHYDDYPFVNLVTLAPPLLFGGNSLLVQHHLTQNQVEAGITYKFDSQAPAPVVAKY